MRDPSLPTPEERKQLVLLQKLDRLLRESQAHLFGGSPERLQILTLRQFEVCEALQVIRTSRDPGGVKSSRTEGISAQLRKAEAELRHRVLVYASLLEKAQRTRYVLGQAFRTFADRRRTPSAIPRLLEKASPWAP